MNPDKHGTVTLDFSMVPRLVIPTRNRPGHIQNLLAYLAHFYPGTQMVVADGSDPDIQPVIQKICEAADGDLDVTFQAYSAQVPLFVRLRDCIESLPDAYLAVTADDDYPVMDTYAQAVKILHKDESLSAVVPLEIILKQTGPTSITARMSPSRPIMQATAAKRITSFSRWRFASSYSVARRETLIARYTALSEVYCAGFVDYQIGVSDCLEGKIGAIAELGCIRTHSYKGSYLRPSDPLVFLRHSQEVLAIVENTVTSLMAADGLDEQAARACTVSAMQQQIASLVGMVFTKNKNFKSSPIFLNPVLQQQYQIFYDLFQAGTATRDAHLEKLLFIKRNLVAQTRKLSDKEESTYETF